MTDIVLVNPKIESCNRELNGDDDNLYLFEIEAYLSQWDYEIHWVNAQKEQMSPEKVAEKTAEYNPLVICVWVMYRSLEYCMSVFKELERVYKDSQAPLITAAGYAATFSAVDLLKSAQSLGAIFLGEPEVSLAGVVNALHRKNDWRMVSGLIYRDTAGQIQQSRRPVSLSLEGFPVPNRHNLRFSPRQWVEIRSSRGCYHSCSFCNVGVFYGMADGPKWRGYPVNRVLQEIKYLYGKGARRFYFVDDQFFGPGKAGIERVRSFALSLLSLNLDIEWQIFCRVDNVQTEIFQLMRQAGLSVVNMGIEGGSQTQLNRMNKQQTVAQIIQAVETIRQLGITLIPSFIMFDPYVTLNEIEANIDLIEQLDFITYLSPNYTIPFPGTSLTKRVIADSLLDIDNPIIPGFLPNTRMINHEAAMLYLLWLNWQSWINNSFNKLEARLVKAAHAYQMSDGTVLGEENLNKLYILARRLKSLEFDYIRTCIVNIQSGHSQDELEALRLQYADAISSIALAVPREHQPLLISKKEVS